MGILAFRTLGIMAIPLSVRGYFEHREWLEKMACAGRTLEPTEIAKRGGDQPGWGGKAKHLQNRSPS